MATRFRNTNHHGFATQMMSEFPCLAAVVMLENDGVASGTLPSLDRVLKESAPLAEDAGTPGCANEVVAVLFTSGSEPKPKGVLFSHNNIIAGERSFAYELGIGFNDRMFMPAPLGHATGYMHGLTMPFHGGWHLDPARRVPRRCRARDDQRGAVHVGDGNGRHRF